MRSAAQDAPESEQNGGIIVVLDSRPLRAAWLAAFIDAWAAGNGMAVHVVDPAGFGQFAAAQPAVRLLALSIGSASVEDEPARGWIEDARAHLPAVPVAVFSDFEDGVAATAALRLGARAYLPTIMEPGVVLHALSFVLAGGSFFPPAALIERPAPRGTSSRSAVRGSRDG